MAGIYIHIPYCKKLCYYCDFYHVLAPESNQAFIDALIREARLRHEYLRGDDISTIYIGGGTPSLLSPGETIRIMSELRTIFKVTEDCEITAELNPEDVSDDYAKGLFETGINRISLGVQS